MEINIKATKDLITGEIESLKIKLVSKCNREGMSYQAFADELDRIVQEYTSEGKQLPDKVTATINTEMEGVTGQLKLND